MTGKDLTTPDAIDRWTQAIRCIARTQWVIDGSAKELRDHHPTVHGLTWDEIEQTALALSSATLIDVYNVPECRK